MRQFHHDDHKLEEGPGAPGTPCAAPIKGIAGAALEKSRGDMLSLVQNMVGADIVIEREGKSEPVEGKAGKGSSQ